MKVVDGYFNYTKDWDLAQHQLDAYAVKKELK